MDIMILFVWGKAYIFLSTYGDLQQELFFFIQHYLSLTTIDIFIYVRVHYIAYFDTN